jgi:hypothetical protein
MPPSQPNFTSLPNGNQPLLSQTPGTEDAFYETSRHYRAMIASARATAKTINPKLPRRAPVSKFQDRSPPARVEKKRAVSKTSEEKDAAKILETDRKAKLVVAQAARDREARENPQERQLRELNAAEERRKAAARLADGMRMDAVQPTSFNNQTFDALLAGINRAEVPTLEQLPRVNQSQQAEQGVNQQQRAAPTFRVSQQQPVLVGPSQPQMGRLPVAAFASTSQGQASQMSQASQGFQASQAFYGSQGSQALAISPPAQGPRASQISQGFQTSQSLPKVVQKPVQRTSVSPPRKAVADAHAQTTVEGVDIMNPIDRMMAVQEKAKDVKKIEAQVAEIAKLRAELKAVKKESAAKDSALEEKTKECEEYKKTLDGMKLDEPQATSNEMESDFNDLFGEFDMQDVSSDLFGDEMVDDDHQTSV